MKRLSFLFVMVCMLLATLLCGRLQAEEIEAKCVSVPLENTCIVRTKDWNLLQVQLWGVEKPAADEALRQRAKKHLAGLILNKEVVLDVVSHDGKSCLARVYAGQTCVNSTMLWCGFLKLNSSQAGGDERYMCAEADARNAASGCWYQNGAVPASVADMTSAPWDVKVNGVVDGDTLLASGEDGRVTRVCLHGCDAPDAGQEGEQEAREALAAELEGKVVRVHIVGEDDRCIKTAKVYADGAYVNQRMLENGWGQVPLPCGDTTLKQAETEARNRGAGLWKKEDLMAPWEYRRMLAERKKAEEEKRRAEEQKRLAEEQAKKTAPINIYSGSSRSYKPSYTPSSGYTPSSSGGTIHVRGYYRKDGTYVRPHTRRRRR